MQGPTWAANCNNVSALLVVFHQESPAPFLVRPCEFSGTVEMHGQGYAQAQSSLHNARCVLCLKNTPIKPHQNCNKEGVAAQSEPAYFSALQIPMEQ
jgi:hypothetical protein